MRNSVSDPRHALGARAERLVCDHLRDRGFTIVETNARVGRLEIDVIARRGDLHVFCEVRARRSAGFVHPLETIDAPKIARIRKAARAWRRDRGIGGAARLDAAAVTFEGDGAQIDYVEDAF